MANGTQFLPSDYELIDPGAPAQEAPVGASDEAYEIIDPGADPAAAPEARQEQEPLPPGSWYDPVIEPAQVMAAGVAGTVAGGLKGLATAATGGTLEEFGESVVETQEAFSEWGAPETQRGAMATQTLGELMEKGVDLARIPLSALAGVATYIGTLGDEEKAKQVVDSVTEQGLGTTMGDEVYEATGSPLLAAAVSVAPDAVAMAIPATAMSGRAAAGTAMAPVKQTPLRQAARAINDPVGTTRRGIATRQERHAELAEAIRNGTADERVAGYIIDGSGRVRRDPNLGAMTDEAVRQGFDRGAVAAVQGASPVDRTAMQEMLAIKRQGDRDKLYKQQNRPADVAGRVIANRVRHVRNVNRAAGRELDTVAKGLKGQRVDFTGPVDDFIGQLDEMGIRFGRNMKPDFKASDVAGSPAAQNLIKKVIEFMKDPGRGTNPDAYDLHRLKRFIDETVTYGKNAEGLAGQAEIIVKGLRRNVDELLDQRFPDYNRVNTTYADTIGALNGLQDVAGRKMDISGQYADSNIGQLMRRLMSNAVSRNNVASSIDDIERIFTKYGGDAQNNPRVLMMFADELDSVFGPAADSSLLGEVTKGVKLGAEAAVGGRGVISTAVDVGRSVTESARGINKDNAYNIMETFLNYERP